MFEHTSNNEGLIKNKTEIVCKAHIVFFSISNLRTTIIKGKSSDRNCINLPKTGRLV